MNRSRRMSLLHVDTIVNYVIPLQGTFLKEPGSETQDYHSSHRYMQHLFLVIP